MSDTRWVKVQVPEALHGRVRQVKARFDVTWDRIVQEGVELWLASAEREARAGSDPGDPE